MPEEAYEYQLGSRSAIEWIIDRYQVRTDPKSGIVSNPKRLVRRPALRRRPAQAHRDGQSHHHRDRQAPPAARHHRGRRLIRRAPARLRLRVGRDRRGVSSATRRPRSPPMPPA
ncbi:type ISP restriction/modification enzyme [Streptomyces sp. NPDC059454]|uniref:type ISP restriction/modification enzyme n=1 Tax=Streptomyces sp. NPDC059454 TaxID=3346836 RepID=UPI0036C66B91